MSAETDHVCAILQELRELAKGKKVHAALDAALVLLGDGIDDQETWSLRKLRAPTKYLEIHATIAHEPDYQSGSEDRQMFAELDLFLGEEEFNQFVKEMQAQLTKDRCGSVRMRVDTNLVLRWMYSKDDKKYAASVDLVPQIEERLARWKDPEVDP